MNIYYKSETNAIVSNCCHYYENTNGASAYQFRLATSDSAHNYDLYGRVCVSCVYVYCVYGDARPLQSDGISKIKLFINHSIFGHVENSSTISVINTSAWILFETNKNAKRPHIWYTFNYVEWERGQIET